jgi:hypothetical protein
MPCGVMRKNKVGLFCIIVEPISILPRISANMNKLPGALHKVFFEFFKER